jgi:hypothetical protein
VTWLVGGAVVWLLVAGCVWFLCRCAAMADRRQEAQQRQLEQVSWRCLQRYQEGDQPPT